MSAATNQHVMHPGTTRIRLRADLRFYPQIVRQPYYLVEDLVRSKYFRVGVAEYTFISLLDGETTLDQAMARAATVAPMSSFTDQNALSICKWLLDNDLAETEGTAERHRRASVPSKPLTQRLNPLTIRLPLIRPDRLFDAITPWTSWLFSAPVVAVWVLLLVSAGYSVTADWNRYAATSVQVFAASNWGCLGICWVILKIVHEMAHGVVCKRYGGVVREAGVLLILFAPLAYVDVTCSWRFRSKWQRIFTATAGMYFETMAASIAALVWCHSPPGILSQFSFNVATMAGINTILFNANPLMRFDGYYILSDWLDLPNLYASGQRYVRYLGQRYWFGMNVRLPEWETPAGVLIRTYGIAACVWRIFVCAGLVIVASTLFHGAGMILSVLAVGLWFGGPLLQLVVFLARALPSHQLNRRYFALVSGSALCLGGLLLFVVPWFGTAAAPMRTAYAPLHTVRADSGGFVRAVLVIDGQSVVKDQVLLELENHELERELRDLELQIRISIAKSRMSEQKNELATAQTERALQQALQQRCAETRAQVEALTVRSPACGQIIGPHLNRLIDAYVEEGGELMAVGNENEKELVLSIAQDKVKQFEN
jgi:putative peptide zinc metalloprotease protein